MKITKPCVKEDEMLRCVGLGGAGRMKRKTQARRQYRKTRGGNEKLTIELFSSTGCRLDMGKVAILYVLFVSSTLGEAKNVHYRFHSSMVEVVLLDQDQHNEE